MTQEEYIKLLEDAIFNGINPHDWEMQLLDREMIKKIYDNHDKRLSENSKNYIVELDEDGSEDKRFSIYIGERERFSALTDLIDYCDKHYHVSRLKIKIFNPSYQLLYSRSESGWVRVREPQSYF